MNQTKQPRVVNGACTIGNHLGYQTYSRRENKFSHFIRTFVLIAVMVMGAGSVWADNFVVLTQSIKVGNDNGTDWAGNTIPASVFEGITLKDQDVIEISRSGTDSKALQVSAGTWGDAIQIFQNYGWTNSTEYIRIGATTVGETSYTADEVIAKIKEKGLVINGTGPMNLKVRLILEGNNRINLSGTISYTGMTDKVAQIGDPVTYTFTLDSKFADVQNVKYKWFINDESLSTDNKEISAGDGYVCKYTQNYTNNTSSTSNTFTFYPHSSTSEKQLTVCVHVSADGYGTNYSADWGHLTIAPMHTPTITQNGNEVTLSVNDGYWIDYKINDVAQSSVYTNEKVLNTLNDGDVISAHTFRHFVVDGTDYYRGSSDVTYTYYNLNQINVNGTDRQYSMYAPNGISGNVGVVISLHGANNDFNNGRVDFNNIADTEKGSSKQFVVVYPRGLNHQQIWGGARSWESYDEASTGDTEFFKAVVNEINNQSNGLTVDYSRIYLAGFSNGGMMAYKAAHKDGDFYAACASVGGFPVNESHLWHAGSKPVPFVHIHGASDNVVTLADYDINTIIHNMIYRNGATFNPNGQSDGGIVAANDNVSREIHNAEEGGAAYYYYKITGMWHSCSHDWNGDGKDDIAPAMWAFFNKTDKVKNVDPTLKFKTYDTENFWNIASMAGFENVNSGKTVLTYGGATKTDANKNVYHSLQFAGEGMGTPHYLKLNVTTTDASATDYFVISLTKVGSSTPVFVRRYQANAQGGDYYVTFNALSGVNEYKLSVLKSRESLAVHVNGVAFYSGTHEENPAFFPTDLATVLSGMNPIYQPIYGQSYDALAKEYLPIANIPVPTESTAAAERTIIDVLKVSNTALTSLNSSTTTEDGKLFVNIAQSGKDGEQVSFKSKNAYILGSGYTMDGVKGIALSHNGPAGMPAYINGSGNFPTTGVIAMKVQGTFDITALLQNDLANNARRMLKLYYTNDQLNGELKEWESWDFNGTRNESNANGYNVLDVNVRMPQLGQDGTCTVFLTYEGAESDDNVWVKGFVIKRPDLDVTIGRTDKLRYVDGSPINSKNDKLTCFGENQPYQWNFDTASFNNTKKEDIEKKKVNQYDGRTYICGYGPNGEYLMDHLLIFSDGQGEDKATFDGRPSNGKHAGYEDDVTDNNEHIEFNHPTKYTGTNTQGTHQDGFDANRRSFTPILSNGLKVNVTGSGWFTIACSAPNGAVNMKVLSSTNGGNTYMNLLREFRVEKSTAAKPETDWTTYRVYLKAHAERDGNKGFWDGNYKEYDAAYGVEVPKLDPEDTQMSLYVVFDKIDGVTYDDADASTTNDDAQLNIHFMQWINEMPADYVFQREENPALLNSLQSIEEGGTAEKPGLYWQAGTSLVEAKTTATPVSGSTASASYASAYGSASQQTRPDGQTSGWGKVSTDLGCKWDIAAQALTAPHTEVDYANGNKNYAGFSHEYSLNQANGTVADKNLEFAIPISGSFFRFMPMKNQFISAYIVPTEATDSKIYVLDETGKPIPYIYNADTNGSEHTALITTEAKMHGWVHAATGLNYDATNKCFTATSGTPAVRIDFAALAGKEYFIVSDNSKIALARMQATGNSWRAAVPEVATALTLTDGAEGTTNSDAITASMAGDGRYATSVTLNRTFKANTWASIVLPFSMNEKKFEEVFGEGAVCVHFTDVDKTTNTVKLTHHFYNMIVAGRPVFIRPTKDLTNPVITDVTLQASAVTTTTNNGFEFFASYDNTTMSKNDLYLNNANAIKYLTAATATYPGMRSFIKNLDGYDPSKGGTSNSKVLFLNFDDTNSDISTGIEELISEEFGEKVVVVTKSTKVYDLNGRVVANGTDINNLPAGIYIVNGSKYVVK